ncbi:unnamed protein product (macronuclear) [Paramecium tetraurelia]|uniref:RBR-type E3 ubiquitin transferase n=1 Tax=Paramecium tetraurelia TaxID=5888 RepID=A0BYT3_PARTE|nr:uncharacterized protein GSPATT00033553001 [Paramecium tetraurelia]CAK63700.1 unnamed protein product [Paramecium tetraurelia]|eukprot:XP_001431098.1 hypothetical protein (macronuclear) [Paramecium tetraurelia strain d4-2]
MNSNQHEQLCQFEQQKPKYQHLYLELYKSKLFEIHGPKLKQSDTLKCQQNKGEQLNGQDDPIYLNIQDSQEQEINLGLQMKNERQICKNNKIIQRFLKNCRFKKRVQLRCRRRLDSVEMVGCLDINQNSPFIQKGFKDCQICLSYKRMRKFLSCSHEFCKSCIVAHLKENIIRGNVLVIMCPQLSCSEQFSNPQIKDLVSHNLYEKYQRFHRRQLISKDKNVRWCPRIDCENYVIGNGNNLLTCSCGQQICFKCGSQYHQGMSCEQAMDFQYLEARKQLEVNDCPNCSVPIEKKGGCNHMTCFKCEYEFCWVCRGKYSSTHYGIFNIFGCAIPGGQVSNIAPLRNPMLIRVMMIIPKLLLTIFLSGGLLILLPFFLIYLILSAPYRLLKRMSYFNMKNHSKCIQFWSFQLFLFFGILLSPITIICAILISPVLLINYVIENF